MPSTSKSQQRLFGWALACKRGAKNCPENVKKLADSMTEEELEKYAKTSHKDLPERVKEAINQVFDIYVELVEAEIGKSLKEYDPFPPIINEKNSPMILQPESKTGKLPSAKAEKVTSKSVPGAKSEVDAPKDGIPQPKGKGISNAKTEPALDKDDHVEKTPPSVDNDKDEKDQSWMKPLPGTEKAGKSPFDHVYTPSIHKFPMGKAKNETRVYNFDQFLKMINYRTHDDTLQKGHGQNLT
jgi:hypothetical protein